jgi:hypothetical protein
MQGFSHLKTVNSLRNECITRLIHFSLQIFKQITQVYSEKITS